MVGSQDDTLVKGELVTTLHQAFDLSFSGLFIRNIGRDLSGFCHMAPFRDNEIAFTAVVMIGDLFTLFEQL